MELVNTIIRKIINIACTRNKLGGKKSKEIENIDYGSARKENHRNEAGMIVDKQIKENVVDIKRLSNRIIGIKLLLGKERPNIINAQVG